VVELASDPGYRQLIVTSRRPFPTMTVSAASATMDSTGDTETVENQYGDAIIAWALRWMMDAEVPNVDRTRLDRIRGEEANKATRATQKFISKPVQPPVTSVRIGGAVDDAHLGHGRRGRLGVRPVFEALGNQANYNVVSGCGSTPIWREPQRHGRGRHGDAQRLFRHRGWQLRHAGGGCDLRPLVVGLDQLFRYGRPHFWDACL
jgi:hypothetical protein